MCLTDQNVFQDIEISEIIFLYKKRFTNVTDYDLCNRQQSFIKQHEQIIFMGDIA